MNPKRDKGFETMSWLFVWVVLAVVGAYAVRAQLQTQRANVRGELDRKVDEAMARGQDELSGFEQDLKRTARQAEARRREQLEKAWGGKIAAAFKNPELSLRDALNEAAKACAPTNAFAAVEVDRFTEFNVMLDSGELISTNEMVAFARAFLPLAKTYVDSIRFSHKGALLAEIDRQDIDFIEDWAHATDQRIAMLLPRESQSRIAEDPALIERYKNEQRISQAMAGDATLREKAERADRNLRRAIETAYDELRVALDSIRKSASVGDIRNLRDLDRCDKLLKGASEHAERAEAFLKDPAQEWQRLLDSEGISGDLREALVKGFPGMFRHNSTKSSNVFAALQTEKKSAQAALRMLASENDKWKFSSGQIFITDEDFARRFEAAHRDLREDMQQTEAALRAWREAIGP